MKCRTYWGSHGCRLPRGHTQPHECDCCTCDDHWTNQGWCLDDDNVAYRCVAKPPYYGPDLLTNFYGEDAGELLPADQPDT